MTAPAPTALVVEDEAPIRVLLAPTGGMGDPQWGKLHLLDGLTPSMRTLNIAKDPACRTCRANAD